MYRTSKPFTHRASSKATFLLLIFVAALSVLRAQPAGTLAEDRKRGITLIEEGKFVEAVKVLSAVTKKNKNDITAWHWVGVAFERQGKIGDARKAHEKAAKLGDALLSNQFDVGPLEDFGAAIRNSSRDHSRGFERRVLSQT